MFARNPKTGKPIRIMKTEASIWRSQKTLVWLQDQSETIQWDRWETVCTDLESIKKWSKTKRIDYVLFTDLSEESINYFTEVKSNDHRMFFVSKAFAKAVGQERYKKINRTNIICLDDAHRLYPFLGDEWDKTNEDAVLLISVIMRISKLVGATPVSNRLSFFKEKNHDLTLVDEQPKQLWLITQFYSPPNTKRQKEIKKCLQMNVLNPLVDKIVLLNEDNFYDMFPLESDTKIEQFVIKKRLTYKIVLEWIAKNIPKNVLCVFANSDIYLDPSWIDLWSVNMIDTFLALLRYEVQEDGSESKIFGPRNDSQDTWVVLSDSVKSRGTAWPTVDFPFGQAGCDNAITVEMLKAKFNIVNPALTLKTHHLHTSQVRNYDPQDVVDRPAYLYVDPTGIHDMKPVFDLGVFKIETKVSRPFSRSLESVQPKSLMTFCKMLERGDRYKWFATEKNIQTELSYPICKYKNVFQTPQGLLFNYNQLYISKSNESKEAWSHSKLSCVTPTYTVKKCLVVPFKESETSTNEGYALYYLSRVLALYHTYGEGDFWSPRDTSTGLLELFNWPTEEVPVLPYGDSTQVWCDEAIQYPWIDKQEIRREDIQALRSAVKDYKEKPTGKKWVVVIDGVHITQDIATALEGAFPDIEWVVFFESRSSIDSIFEKLRGASGLLLYGGPNSISRWGYSWILPSGSTVLEVQNEMEPSGECAHVSGAADLVHKMIFLPKANPVILQKETIRLVTKTLSVTTVLPIIRLPRSSLTGFYAHAGDSFREMASLWAEKGYVQCVEDSKAVQVWLGSVGDCLLYDRPTLDWLMTAPDDEQSWKVGLFGNPKPPDSGKAWTFWARRPRILEDLVNQGVAKKTFSERSKTLVFYGKIENRVQEKRRTTYDWSSICDDYVMVKGSEAYPLTHTEYLEKLADSKFGLCLGGFGKKCHREVECMGLGTVPVITADVDMTYANPPIEGTHYLKISQPSDFEKLSVNEDTWQRMSTACKEWWKENASAEGSWNLTKKLITP